MRWLVLLVVLGVFAPTIALTTVTYDDPWLWSEDSPLRAPTPEVLEDIFFELDFHARRPLGSEYLPVRDLVVAADMAVWGDNEHGLHVTQLGLFLLTVLGLGSLLVGFGLRKETAWLGVLIWAIHPSHVEAVAWLSERKGILAGLFAVGCGHAWLRFRRGGHAAWLLAAMLAAIAAIWSKAPAMAIGPALAAFDWYLLPAHRRRWITIGAVGLASVLAAVPVMMVALDANVVSDGVSAVDRSPWTLVPGVIGHYVQSLACMTLPSVAYPIQIAGPSAVDLALGIAAIAGSLLLWWRSARPLADDAPLRWRRALIAWTALWFLPVSQLALPVHIIVADRYVYLATLGACIGVAAVVMILPPASRRIVGALLVGVLSVLTIRATHAWTSSHALWQRALAVSPADPKAVENYALVLQVTHREEALAVVVDGLRYAPLDPNLRLKQALLAPSDAYAATAIATLSGSASAQWWYGELLRRDGRVREAAYWFERAWRKQRGSLLYIRSHAHSLVALGRHAEALPLLAVLIARTGADIDRRAFLAEVSR
jgi:hypothetical protein